MVKRYLLTTLLAGMLSVSGCVLVEGLGDAPESGTPADANEDLGVDLGSDAGEFEAGDDGLVGETTGNGDAESPVDANDSGIDAPSAETSEDTRADDAAGETTVGPDAGSDASTVSDSAGDTTGPDSAAADAGCTPGTVSCRGDELHQCKSDHSDELLVVCPIGTCNASLGRCTSCTPNELSCDGAKRLKCDALGAVRNVVESCITPELCTATTGETCKAPVCSVAQRRCTGKDAEVCNSGRTGYVKDRTCDIDCFAGVCLEIVQMTAGKQHACALLTDGTVRCWGDNSSGQLGLSVSGSVSRPTAVPSLTDVAEIRAGQTSTCARLNGLGGIVCWGANDSGQLGDGTKTSHLAPIAVSGVSGAVEIAMGQAHACARISDGTVKCWGTMPVESSARLTASTIAGLSNIAQLALGDQHSCARSGTGVVYCWGENFFGQLGDGTNASRDAVAAIAGLTASQIAAGMSHTCARLTDGTVRCWGMNNQGELGDGTLDRYNSPHAVPALSGVLDLAAGGEATCAKLAPNDLRCWGQYPGDGIRLYAMTPYAVPLTGVLDIAVGGGMSFTKTATTTIRAWGDNGAGQLGTGVAGAAVLSPSFVSW